MNALSHARQSLTDLGEDDREVADIVIKDGKTLVRDLIQEIVRV